jgi:glycosyltransferase involved in cell wall biosynthesis
LKRETHLPSMEVIIAALNEEEGIGLTIREIMVKLGSPRVLVVDGMSTDKTAQIAQSMGADLIFQEKPGKGSAIAKAIECSNLTVDYIVITDADYTYPAEYVLNMIQTLENHPEVGMVCGNRFNGEVDPKALKTVFNFGNRLIAFTHNLLNGVPLQDPLTGLRVVRSKLLKNWQVKSQGFDIEVELNHHVERQGFSIVELPIRYRERLGQKKLGIKHGAEIFKRIILETTY